MTSTSLALNVNALTHQHVQEAFFQDRHRWNCLIANENEQRKRPFPDFAIHQIVEFLPHFVATLCKKGRIISQQTTLTKKYLEDLAKYLGGGYLGKSVIKDHVSSASFNRSSMDSLVKDLCQRTVVISSEKAKKGFLSSTQFIAMERWIQQENRNLLSIIPSMIGHAVWNDVKENIQNRHAELNEEDMLPILATEGRKRINRWKDEASYVSCAALGLDCFPEDLFKLKKLQFLYLQNNRLEAIPKQINMLPHLITLYIVRNHLRSLPKELEEFSHLENLLISYNQITSLPSFLLNCRSLKKLQCDNNPLDKDSHSVITQLREKGITVIM